MHNISLTPTALAKAIELSKKTENIGLSLRIYLDGKGCDGFFYGVSFDKASKDDLVKDQESLSLIIDPDSLTFCDGSEIEWVDDERGTGFLVNNPNHRKFRGKFYKRSSWQKALEQKQQN